MDLDFLKKKLDFVPSSLDFLQLGLGIPSARFGIPSARFGIPSARFGIPSVRAGRADPGAAFRSRPERSDRPRGCGLRAASRTGRAIGGMVPLSQRPLQRDPAGLLRPARFTDHP